jgi:uncharacterized membrane protein YgcG
VSLMNRSRLVALALAVLMLASTAAAKSFRFASIDQEVRVLTGGNVSVIDTRVYDFEGSYSNAFLDLKPRSGGRVILQGVTAPDGKGVRNVRQEDGVIRWQYTANDERRTFRITYTLTNELQVASDVALFDRQILEPEHAPVDSYRLRIVAPEPSPENFRVFIFTGRSRIGQLSFDDPKQVATVTLPEVSENEAVRARVLMPSGAFAFRNVNGTKLEEWLAETERQTADFRRASEEAVRRGESGGASLIPPSPPTATPLLLAPWLLVAAVGWWVLITYQRFGREPGTQDVGRYYREPAEEIPPAVVPYVMSQASPGLSAAGQAIGATLLDWARQGNLELVPHENAGFLGIGRSTETRFQPVRRPDNMTPFEADLWGVLQASGGRDGIVSPEELKRYFRAHQNWGKNWVQEPRAWYESTRGFLLDQGASNATRPVTVLAFLAALGAIGGGFMIAQTTLDLGLSLIVAGFVALIVAIVAAVVMPRWTPRALLNARKWKAYKNFLADFSQMEQAPAEHYKMWDYHFIYATALGVSERYLANLKRLMEQHPNDFARPMWLGHYYGGAGGMRDAVSSLTALNSLSDISSNLSGLNSALRPANTSSGGGFGGGSMGGSSGGGGSSGAS